MATVFFVAWTLVAADPEAGAALGLDSALVIYNTHNAFHNDRGTTKANLYLAYKGKVVWEKKNVEIPWERDRDTVTQINIPKRKYDGIRVEVREWYGHGGGFSEIELWQRGKNLAEGTLAIASKTINNDPTYGPLKVTDGIASSETKGKGYWLLPNTHGRLDRGLPQQAIS